MEKGPKTGAETRIGVHLPTLHDPGLSKIVAETLFDKIRADPRWVPFLRKIDKTPEQLAKIEFKVSLPTSEGGATSGGAHP